MPAPNVESNKTAVIVLDVQPIIISMIPGSQDRLSNILRVIDAGQAASCLTVYVRVAFEHHEWKSIGPNVKNFYEMKQQMGSHESAPDFLHVSSDMTALHPKVQERVATGASLLIRKTRFGAFSSPELLETLKAHKIDTLVVVGFKTSGAVLSTVRFAADHDFKVVVVRDAVLDPDEEVDTVLLDKVIPEQAHVVDLADVEASLATSGKAVNGESMWTDVGSENGACEARVV
ncbi:hypothetical protein CBS101457_004937 [Exobasidium rhododendri]|nr:hypothetical protein CBS101457_004937 [Exobasidium rhododendri]